MFWGMPLYVPSQPTFISSLWKISSPHRLNILKYTKLLMPQPATYIISLVPSPLGVKAVGTAIDASGNISMVKVDCAVKHPLLSAMISTNVALTVPLYTGVEQLIQLKLVVGVHV